MFLRKHTMTKVYVVYVWHVLAFVIKTFNTSKVMVGVMQQIANCDCILQAGTWIRKLQPVFLAVSCELKQTGWMISKGQYRS